MLNGVKNEKYIISDNSLMKINKNTPISKETSFKLNMLFLEMDDDIESHDKPTYKIIKNEMINRGLLGNTVIQEKKKFII